MRFTGSNVVSAAPAGRVDGQLQTALRERSAAHKKEVSVLTECFGVLRDAALVFETAREKERVDEVREAGRELLELMGQVDVNGRIINELFAGQQKEGETLTEFVARRMGELERAKRPEAYKGHRLWQGMRKELWDVNHEGEPLPAEEGEGGGGGGGGMDEEEVAVAKKISLVCPLTTAQLEHPVRNPACGHVFSKAAATEYIQRKKSRRDQPECPVVGCDKILRDLEDDQETERALARAATQGKKKRTRTELSMSQNEK